MAFGFQKYMDGDQKSSCLSRSLRLNIFALTLYHEFNIDAVMLFILALKRKGLMARLIWLFTPRYPLLDIHMTSPLGLVLTFDTALGRTFSYFIFKLLSVSYDPFPLSQE
jgi:hypothetical protein